MRIILITKLYVMPDKYNIKNKLYKQNYCHFTSMASLILGTWRSNNYNNFVRWIDDYWILWSKQKTDCILLNDHYKYIKLFIYLIIFIITLYYKSNITFLHHPLNFIFPANYVAITSFTLFLSNFVQFF